MNSGGLKRVLGPVSLVFYGIGIIVGAGIYSVIGAAAGEAGSGLWLSFLVSGAAALLTALSYAELAAAMPKAGAEYVYLTKAFPAQRWVAFLTGFLTLAAGIMTATTVALAFGGYVRLFFDAPQAIIAFGLLTVCMLINLWGIQEASWINITLTTLEVLGLILVIVLGVQMPEFGRDLSLSVGSAGIMAGASLIFFVYLGFEDLANLAEESTEPARDLPRALLISLGISTFLYVLVALAAVALVTPEALAGSESPLATAVAGQGGVYSTAIAWIALASTANTCLIAMIGVSRMLFGMSRDGEFPAFLASTIASRKTPLGATLFIFGGAALALLFRKIEVVAAVSSFAALLAFLAVNVSVIALRYREPDLERPFRVPLTIGRVPLPSLLGLLVCVALLFRFDTPIYVAGFIGIAIGLLYYFLIRPLVGTPAPIPEPAAAS